MEAKYITVANLTQIEAVETLHKKIRPAYSISNKLEKRTRLVSTLIKLLKTKK